MKIEFDEAKRNKTLEERGLDMARAIEFLAAAPSLGLMTEQTTERTAGLRLVASTAASLFLFGQNVQRNIELSA